MMRPDTYLSMPVLAVVISIYAFTSAEAALIESDIFSPGDQLGVVDTSSGLEWLDLPLTQAFHLQDFQDTYAPLGFSIADGSQVATLFQNAIPEVAYGVEHTFAPGDVTGELFGKIGGVIVVRGAQDESEIRLITGVFRNGSGYSRAELYVEEPDEGSSRVFQSVTNFYHQTEVPFEDVWRDRGSIYAVRTAVIPEPSTSLLLAFGLTGMAAHRRRVN